ncbi:GlpG protein [Vibrio cholerae]|nr:GlpG protein [Vibrio cholerae]
MGFMLIWLVLGYVQPFMAIANTAHLAGLISGVVLAWFDSQRDQQA